jgi:glycosyltransferase involved in cell wall biosynthesis
LRVERPNLQLIVLGAPGPDSDLGRRWSASAQRAGQRIDFSGILSDPVEFAALAANASVMVFADRVGPSSRKTTLASALASGTPTIAFDGPDTWRALRTERAVELVGADPIPLAETIGRLLDDEEARAALGARGHDFYAGHQSAAVTVPHLVEFLQTVTG